MPPSPNSLNDVTQLAQSGIDPATLVSELDAIPKELNPKKDEFSWQEHSKKIQALENSWKTEFQKTERRRAIRNIKVDNEALRKDKKIAADETLIPDRLIDTNIRREQPPVVRYLIESERIGIFKPLVNKNLSVRALEDEVTRCVRIPNWMLSFIKAYDGTQTHGWDGLEITFDSAMNNYGDLSFRQIGHGNLVFPYDTADIQACQSLELFLDLTTSVLKSFGERFGWSETQIEKVVGKTGESELERVHRVRKYLFRVTSDPTVYVAYYHPDADDWLKAPEKLWLGKKELRTTTIMQDMPVGISGTGEVVMQQVPVPTQQWEEIYETRYPVVLFYYYETEDKKLTAHLGRVHLDEYKQEAATALLSAQVNRAYRSSNVYAAPKNATGTGLGTPKLTTQQLINGGIYDNPIDFFSMGAADPSILATHQYLATQNAQETNQVAWAVNNRQDSRKTAREVDSADQKQSEMSSIVTVLFSMSIAEFVVQVWEIIRSRAQQGMIKFLEGHPEKEALLNEPYAISAAGDIDVVKRDKTLMTMMQDWQVVSMTPLAPMFLADYLKKRYPDNGERYAQIIMQAAAAAQAQQQQGSAQLIALKGMAEKFGDQMTPEQRDGLAQVIQASIQPTQQGAPTV